MPFSQYSTLWRNLLKSLFYGPLSQLKRDVSVRCILLYLLYPRGNIRGGNIVKNISSNQAMLSEIPSHRTFCVLSRFLCKVSTSYVRYLRLMTPSIISRHTLREPPFNFKELLFYVFNG